MSVEGVTLQGSTPSLRPFEHLLRYHLNLIFHADIIP
jgi:hypothetical protein